MADAAWGEWWARYVTPTLAAAGFILGVFGLGLSLFNAYISVIRQVDDLRVSISSLPSLTVDLSNNRGALSSDEITFAFINAGNRPAAVLGAKFVVIPSTRDEYYEMSQERRQRRRWDGPPEHCYPGPTLVTEREAVVVKEKEIVTKTMKLRPVPKEGFEIGADALPTFLVRREPNEDVFVKICLEFTVATPSVGAGWRAIEVESHKFEVKPGGNGGGGGGPDLPFVIWQHRATIFSKEFLRGTD